jgi:hypothetical protein
MKRNPRKVKWTKAYRRMHGKDMTQVCSEFVIFYMLYGSKQSCQRYLLAVHVTDHSEND